MTTVNEVGVIELPGEAQAGDYGTWTLPIADGESESLVITGRFLGVGSSRRSTHVGHPGTPFQRVGGRCPACRWFEPRIFRVDDGPPGARYLIFYVGQSRVPNEVPRVRYEWVLSPHEVIEALTTRRDGEAFLTLPAGRVLAQAATFDEDLEFAYVNRAVQ